MLLQICRDRTPCVTWCGFVVLGLCACALAASCKREESAPVRATPPATAAADATRVHVAGDLAPAVVAANNRGVGLMGKFEYDNARQAFDQALGMSMANHDLRVNLAIATLNRQREGDEERALALLDQTLASDPSNLRAQYVVGLLRLYLQSPELAQPHFQKVVDGDAGDAFATYYLGQCLAQQKYYDRALQQYERAIALDPRIRSAYYAASQALRALGRDDDAGKMLAQFQELETNPQARLAEFKYTRMGPKAMAQAIDVPEVNRVALRKPEGPVFLDPQPLLTNGDQFRWKGASAGVAAPTRAISITAADIDRDDDIDIFIANCLDGDDGLHNAVCINDGRGQFTLDPDHILAQIPDVNAALWGDVDNDGFTDVYLCRKGPNMLWRLTQSPPEKVEWRDVTAASGVANGENDSVDGALFDADHDGDLDVFIVNADGPNELFNNNGDDTFKPIAAQADIAGSGKGSRQVLPVDLDGDRDLDIIVIGRAPAHDIFINDRAWVYRRARHMDALEYPFIDAIVSGDSNSDGEPELYAICNKSESDHLFRWTTAGEGQWKPTPVAAGSKEHAPQPQMRSIALVDAGGDATLDLASIDQRGQIAFWSIETGIATLTLDPPAKTRIVGAAFVSVAGGSGPALVAATERAPLIWRPGPGRFPFASASFTGRQVTSDNKQVRSNVSGIGTHYAARIDSMWVAGHTLRNSSGPGQSLQPVAIGLGPHDKIDFLSIDWSDGVFQSEIELAAGKHHVIEETQRQLASCPVLFAWDGQRYRFITDLLGVGGLGYLLAPGEYAPARPWENLLLPAGVPQPRDGEMILKLGEPMEEACYLDAARLIAYDLPPGWDMALDERMNIAGPEPTGEAMFYRSNSLRVAQRAMNDRGQDVTGMLRDVDLVAAPLAALDDRYIGLLKGEHVLTLSFDAAEAESERAPGRVRLALLIDGWVEYPYSQTMFAAWQARAGYHAPTLEVKTASGEWTTVYQQFGYPAGMPRQMSLPLPAEPAFDGSTPIELRLRTNQEVYFDRIALVEMEDCPDARRNELALNTATLAEVGFPRRSTGLQRQPFYNYDQRAPLWDTRHQRGWYSEVGPVNELVAKQDDAVAIFGPGEEIELRFDVAALPEAPGGWTRRFVFEARGWCKDMDLYTREGETLEPLPSSDAAPDTATRDALHRRFNTRYQSGR